MGNMFKNIMGALIEVDDTIDESKTVPKTNSIPIAANVQGTSATGNIASATRLNSPEQLMGPQINNNGNNNQFVSEEKKKQYEDELIASLNNETLQEVTLFNEANEKLKNIIADEKTRIEAIFATNSNLNRVNILNYYMGCENILIKEKENFDEVLKSSNENVQKLTNQINELTKQRDELFNKVKVGEMSFNSAYDSVLSKINIIKNKMEQLLK